MYKHYVTEVWIGIHQEARLSLHLILSVAFSLTDCGWKKIHFLLCLNVLNCCFSLCRCRFYSCEITALQQLCGLEFKSVISCNHFVISLLNECSWVLMVFRSSLSEWIALKIMLSGVASGLSQCISARGPSRLRVWPIKKDPNFIHYDPAEHSSI